MSMNSNRLITGGGGLIGTEMPDDYGQKPTRGRLNLSHYDSVLAYIWENKIDEIIHLAAKVGGVKANHENMLDFFSDNLSMNANIVKVCGKLGIKKATFMLSTCVFPQDVKYPVCEGLLHEGEPHYTNYGYAYAKRMLEVGARALRKQKGIQARCVIPCNVYGKNDNYNLEDGHVIPSLIHKCYLAKRDGTPFHVWGFGRAEREFIYAPDIARAVRMIHEDTRDIPNLMIVSPSKAHTIRSIVGMICECLDFKGEIVFDSTKPEGILRKPTMNNLFMECYPDFKFTDIHDGIAETCDHVRRNYDSIRK